MQLTRSQRAVGFAFVTAFVTLCTQVLVHRVVSAKLLNNFAFLVISLTMLGFALSGVVLTRWLKAYLEHLEDALPASAALFVLSLLLACTTYYRAELPMVFLSRPAFVAAFAHSLPFALLLALPFLFCGLILGALLSDTGLPTGRVYFFDLLGSATGAFAVIPAIAFVGVEAALLLCCGIFLAVSLVLSPPRAAWSRALTALALGLLALATAGSGWFFRMAYPERTPLWDVEREGPPYGIETVAWDPVARIEVSRIRPPNPRRTLYSSLLGSDPAFLQRFERMITQNNTAFTYAVHYDGRRESLHGIEDTVYASAYQASDVPRPRVLVIGVGGGFDILTALYFEASAITAVEINSATVGLLRGPYRDYTRAWLEDPRLDLQVADGRHYLERHAGPFDVLQLSGVDSYSGTAGSAHVFSENYLYTQEALDLYYSRLAPEGILNLMRLEYQPPREMLRALVTAVRTLRRAGVARPAEHVVMLSQPNGAFVAMLVKKTPFRPEQVQKLQTWLAANPRLVVAAAPGLRLDNNYSLFLEQGGPEAEAAFVASAPFDIEPATDDRPFFFKYSFWWHVFPTDPLIWMWTPFMEYSVILLLLTVGLVAVVCVYAPLRMLTARSAFAPGTRRFGLYFACLGLGYLAVEMAYLQKFGLFLGHPNYALSVVLAALLFSSGLGALCSPRLPAALREPRFLAYLASALILAEHLLVLPHLRAGFGWPFGLRVLATSALVAPVGFCLGTFLPTGLERLKATAPEYAPWAWGLNGIFSVLAPVLAISFSMSHGIAALLLAAVPVYLLGTLALPAAPRPEVR